MNFRDGGNLSEREKRGSCSLDAKRKTTNLPCAGWGYKEGSMNQSAGRGKKRCGKESGRRSLSRAEKKAKKFN